jgi:hypothetical protein
MRWCGVVPPLPRRHGRAVNIALSPHLSPSCPPRLPLGTNFPFTILAAYLATLLAAKSQENMYCTCNGGIDGLCKSIARVKRPGQATLSKKWIGPVMHCDALL